MRAPGWLKTPARLMLQGLGAYGSYKLAHGSFLARAGWFRSFREGRSVDAEGNPLPWIPYPAIRFLAGRVGRDFSVFEFGAGASTLWWAGRVARLVSCEHDPRWLAEIEGKLTANVTLLRRPLDENGEYARAIAGYPGSFDVVVVDGRDRVLCARNAIAALKPGGVIVWDDTDRPEYGPGIEFLTRQGFRRLEFIGMAPGKVEGGETSIFYREGNCLGI